MLTFEQAIEIDLSLQLPCLYFLESSVLTIIIAKKISAENLYKRSLVIVSLSHNQSHQRRKTSSWLPVKPWADVKGFEDRPSY